MLEKMNLYGKDPEDVVEALEIAEALAEGDGAASPAGRRARELRAAGTSYSAIAKELFAINSVSAFHINTVKRMLGEEITQGPARRRKAPPPGVTEQKPERRGQRTPQGDGGGHLLALADDSHTRGNGHVDLSPAQFSKLWQIVTGGQVRFRVEVGQVTCQVSFASFEKALPVLLDSLKG